MYTWSSETLKSQVIAARTYAVYKARSRTAYSFDVDDTTANQAFIMTNIDSRTDAAVNATNDYIITYN
ncbi:MAG: hypothetical protein LBS11_04515 [Oscillospiraceae bacterium]|nr:hypothetical protein [Oscillospiraceae bacterium]